MSNRRIRHQTKPKSQCNCELWNVPVDLFSQAAKPTQPNEINSWRLGKMIEAIDSAVDRVKTSNPNNP